MNRALGAITGDDARDRGAVPVGVVVDAFRDLDDRRLLVAGFDAERRNLTVLKIGVRGIDAAVQDRHVNRLELALLQRREGAAERLHKVMRAHRR